MINVSFLTGKETEIPKKVICSKLPCSECQVVPKFIVFKCIDGPNKRYSADLFREWLGMPILSPYTYVHLWYIILKGFKFKVHTVTLKFALSRIAPLPFNAPNHHGARAECKHFSRHHGHTNAFEMQVQCWFVMSLINTQVRLS